MSSPRGGSRVVGKSDDAADDHAAVRGRSARRGRADAVYVHVIDHPDARVLVDTGITELRAEVADLDPASDH
jgi:hypothetical protein